VAVDVDLEVEVAADRAGVAGLADGADSLTGEDALAGMGGGRARHVGVEVAAVLSFAVDQQVVAVEDGVVAGAQDPAAPHRDEGGSAGGDDVEAFVPAPAAARRAEFADRPARAVRAVDGEDVVVEAGCAVVSPARGRSGENGEQDER
jgi:hypothetical protein